MAVTMSIALLLLRLGIGLTMVGHGVQKLFGWFNGPCLNRMKKGFEKQRFRPVWPWLVLAIVGEVGGGLSVTLGFLTPLGDEISQRKLKRKQGRRNREADLEVITKSAT